MVRTVQPESEICYPGVKFLSIENFKKENWGFSGFLEKESLIV